MIENFNCENINQVRERELYHIRSLNVNTTQCFRLKNNFITFQCECGETVKNSNKRFHDNSSNHMAYLNKLYDEREKLNNVIEEPKPKIIYLKPKTNITLEKPNIIVEKPKTILSNPRITCGCGSEFYRNNNHKHYKSIKHQDYLKSLE